MSQSRVSSELLFVISRRHRGRIELAGAAASPVTDLGLRLQGPDDFEGGSRLRVRIVELSLGRTFSQYTHQSREILESGKRPRRSETGKIKVARSNSPVDFRSSQVNIEHRFVRGQLTRVDCLFASAPAPFFNLDAAQKQATC